MSEHTPTQTGSATIVPVTTGSSSGESPVTDPFGNRKGGDEDRRAVLCPTQQSPPSTPVGGPPSVAPGLFPSYSQAANKHDDGHDETPPDSQQTIASLLDPKPAVITQPNSASSSSVANSDEYPTHSNVSIPAFFSYVDGGKQNSGITTNDVKSQTGESMNPVGIQTRQADPEAEAVSDIGSDDGVSKSSQDDKGEEAGGEAEDTERNLEDTANENPIADQGPRQWETAAHYAKVAGCFGAWATSTVATGFFNALIGVSRLGISLCDKSGAPTYEGMRSLVCDWSTKTKGDPAPVYECLFELENWRKKVSVYDWGIQCSKYTRCSGSQMMETKIDDGAENGDGGS